MARPQETSKPGDLARDLTKIKFEGSKKGEYNRVLVCSGHLLSARIAESYMHVLLQCQTKNFIGF